MVAKCSGELLLEPEPVTPKEPWCAGEAFPGVPIAPMLSELVLNPRCSENPLVSSGELLLFTTDILLPCVRCVLPYFVQSHLS